MDTKQFLRRPSFVEVDLGQIAANVGVLRRHLGDDVRIFATLKADAYGFGLIPVARTVAAAGIDGLAVGDAFDAVALREAGLTLPILMHSGTPIGPELAEVSHRLNLMPTLHDREAAERLAASGHDIDVFVKIEAGLERLGVLAEEAPAYLEWLSHLPRLHLAGVYTHLHPAIQRPDLHDYLIWQFQRFTTACDKAIAAGVNIPLRMASSTAILRQRDDMFLNAVDPGNALFGMDGGGTAAIDLGVKPALHGIRTNLLQVRAVHRLGFIDAAPVKLRPNMRIGVIPFGFCDNFDRMHAGAVLVHGRRAPVLGNASLEHTRIDLTDIPEAVAGDEVVVLGQQGKATISAQEIREHNKHPRALDLMMAIGRVLPRRYIGAEAAAEIQVC